MFVLNTLLAQEYFTKYLNFLYSLNIKIVMWCLNLIHREFPERISLCFTAAKITKTSQETRNFFEADFLFVFGASQVPSWNIRKFLILRLESFISRNIIFPEWFFLFFRARKVTSWNFLFLRLESSVLRNKRNGFWENIRNFFRVGFFRKKFWGLRPGSALGSYFCKTFHRRRLAVFWICLWFWVYQGS